MCTPICAAPSCPARRRGSAQASRRPVTIVWQSYSNHGIARQPAVAPSRPRAGRGCRRDAGRRRQTMLRSSGGSWHRRGNHSWASPPGGSGAMGSSLELTASRLSLAPSLQLAYGVACIQAVQHRDDAVPAAAICSHMPGLCMGIVHGACMACTRALYQACACNVQGLCVARERLSTHSKLPLACRCRTALAGEAGRGQRWRQVGEEVRWRARRGPPLTVRVAVRKHRTRRGTRPTQRALSTVRRLGAPDCV